MTIKDIARMAGVSVSTVSRVLNHHPDVSAPVRAQVMAVVEEQHFIPNSAARNLVRPQCNAVGVIQYGELSCGPILSAIQTELDALGYTMCLRQVHLGQDELACAAELERSEKLKGIILLGGRLDYTQEMVAPLTSPFVCCTYTNRFGDLKPEQYSSVSVDDEAAAAQAVEYLCQMGHREIALLLPEPEERSVGELRRRGYCRALEALGLPLLPERIVRCRGSELDCGYDAVRQLLQSGTRFTALLATSDWLALAAIKALHDGGIQVPQDCSVMGIGGLKATEYTLPPLTTLVQPQEELGRHSVQLLAQVLEEGGAHRHVILQPAFRGGGSVRKLDE